VLGYGRSTCCKVVVVIVSCERYADVCAACICSAVRNELIACREFKTCRYTVAVVVIGRDLCACVDIVPAVEKIISGFIIDGSCNRLLCYYLFTGVTELNP